MDITQYEAKKSVVMKTQRKLKKKKKHFKVLSDASKTENLDYCQRFKKRRGLSVLTAAKHPGYPEF